ncbi:MAG: hypothetical protein RBS57_12785, partial [Desulforhabdus sp.]|nr:hypothetical protein [Desulforhabdus sp.]
MIQIRWQLLNDRRPGSVQEIMEILLRNRGVGKAFLSGSLKDLELYLSMRGMAEGAELMAWHLSKGHKVVIVGDYDCDGVTSAAQISLFLRDIGYCNH